MFKKHAIILYFLIYNCVVYSQVDTLIKTTWGQNCYYNMYLPSMQNKNACDKAYAGCFAVAWAQIFNYYNFPKKPIGDIVFNENFPDYKLKLDSITYNYSNLPTKLRSENKEVAKLIYHIGLACNTKWDNIISNTYFDASKIINHFGYSSKIKIIDLRALSKAEKLKIIKFELDNKRPVFAKNAFHYYIIDGYDAKNYLHYNFGWNGQFNGFYDIENCNIPPGNMNPLQIMVNIEPNNVAE